MLATPEIVARKAEVAAARDAALTEAMLASYYVTVVRISELHPGDRLIPGTHGTWSGHPVVRSACPALSGGGWIVNLWAHPSVRTTLPSLSILRPVG